MKSLPFVNKPCNLFGGLFGGGRFLILIWYPTRKVLNSVPLQDYECYFLENRGDGHFEGIAHGYFAHLGRVKTFEHLVRRVEPQSDLMMQPNLATTKGSGIA